MASMTEPLLSPPRLWSRAEVLSQPCPVPTERGVYAWYFTDPPPLVPVHGCHVVDGAVLLYVGISPRMPSANGGRASSQNIRKRIMYHYRGNAEGSTLRLTLGCLLSEHLGIGLRRVGSGQRFTFSTGEVELSEWLSRHARVCWVVDQAPWKLESALLGRLVLPLNLDQNPASGFRMQLSRIRAVQRQLARDSPVLPR